MATTLKSFVARVLGITANDFVSPRTLRHQANVAAYVNRDQEVAKDRGLIALKMAQDGALAVARLFEAGEKGLCVDIEYGKKIGVTSYKGLSIASLVTLNEAGDGLYVKVAANGDNGPVIFSLSIAKMASVTVTETPSLFRGCYFPGRAVYVANGRPSLYRREGYVANTADLAF